MNGPVDVLNLLELAAMRIRNTKPLVTGDTQRRICETMAADVMEAHAALSELVDAVRAERLIVRSRRRPTPESLQQAIDRTDAALAKVGAAP